MQYPAQKILIIKLRAIGDVIMSSIMLPSLRAAYPNAEIDFVTERPCLGAISGCQYLNRVHISPTQGWRAQLEFLLKLRAENYDLVFDMFGNPRSAIQSVVSGAKKRIGYNWRVRQIAYNQIVQSRSDFIHEADWHLDALTALNIPIISKELCFAIPAAAERFAEQFWEQSGLTGKTVIAINTSGGWAAKRWPLGQFAALANRIGQALPAKLLLIWGPGELPEAEQLSKLCQYPAQLIPTTDLKQLAALLKRCQVLISTDSGPMHVAAAVKTPTVGIFGPTNPRHQGPYGSQHEVVVKHNPLRPACRRLDCDHPDCHAALTIEPVWQALLRCMEKNSIKP